MTQRKKTASIPGVTSLYLPGGKSGICIQAAYRPRQCNNLVRFFFVGGESCGKEKCQDFSFGAKTQQWTPLKDASETGSLCSLKF